MPCVTNAAHANHTLLRGCCTSTCPCPGESFSSEPYCPCNDPVAQNQTSTYRAVLCEILADAIASFDGNGAQFNAALGVAGLFSRVACGSFQIITSGEALVGTVTNGVYTAGDNLANGTYHLFISNTAGSQCGGNLTLN